MKEVWKHVIDFEGIYEVSSYGRVRTCKDKITHTNKHGIRHWKQRILKPREDKKGKNLSVCLWKNGNGKSYLIHRLVATAFIPNPNNLYTVNHKNGDRKDNRLENLEWMSLHDNIIHGFENDLYKCNKTIIIDKKNDNQYFFRSMSVAGVFIGRSTGYINCALKRNKFENDRYKWVVKKTTFKVVL